MPTIYFGDLVSLPMLGGLVGNVASLPLLIDQVEVRAKKQARIVVGTLRVP